MAHVVIITHSHDDFRGRNYLLGSLAKHWIEAGHRISLAAGLDDLPAADLAVLHVDLSVIPQDYFAALKRYPLALNGQTLDIRKRRLSRHLVQRNDAWRGPVIVKTDLNYGGLPEVRLQLLQKKSASPIGAPTGNIAYIAKDYPVLPSSKDVPDHVWENAGLIVERFLPERDERGYWCRAWVFLGDQERCSRYLSQQPIVKGRNIIAREPALIPEFLRAERQRLGFDYGKFDFVIHNGKPILIDVNRTPTAPPRSAETTAANAALARGLDSFLKTA